MDFKSLIINLKIIGKINSGEKLNTRNKYFTIDQASILQGPLRAYRRDDRNVTCEKIAILVKEVHELIESTDMNKVKSFGFEDETDDFNEYMKPIIEDAVKGLSNLKITYEKDNTFLAQMDLEIDNLVRLANKIKIKKF